MYIQKMAWMVSDCDNVEVGEGLVEPAFEAWKRAKITRGLAESRDRSVMIPIEQVWRDLDRD